MWQGKNVQIFWVRHSKDPSFAIKRLRAACGRVPVSVIHLKDIEYAPVRYASEGSDYVPDDYKIIRYNQWESPTDAEAPEAAYFVCLYKGDIENFGSLSLSSLEQIKDRLVAIGEEDLPIVGVPKTKRSQIRKNPGWKELIPLAQEVLPQCIEEEKLLALYVHERYQPVEIAKRIATLRSLIGENIFDPLVAGTAIDTMNEKFALVSEQLAMMSTAPKVILDLLSKLKIHSVPIVDETRKEADQIVTAYEKACDQVNRDFALLKHLSLPKVPDAQVGKVINLEKARERRLAILPFYVWLKSVRPVREVQTHRILGAQIAA
jgi:hypothetical protein